MEITVFSILFFIMIPVAALTETRMMKELKVVVTVVSCMIGFIAVQHLNLTKRPTAPNHRIVISGSENRIP